MGTNPVRRAQRAVALALVMVLGASGLGLDAASDGTGPPPGGALGDGPDDASGHGTPPAVNYCADAPVLRLTSPPMAGNDVWELKSRLRQLGFDAGDPGNETYDAAAAAAVRRFQQSRGLVPDGVVGPQTWAALAEGAEPAAVQTRTPKPQGQLSIVVDSEKLTLTVLVDGKPYKTYPVAVGRPKASTLTPVGEWKIIHKGVNWGGGFGTRWLGLNVPWGIYGIHGTNKPYSIGTRASAGCIRMFNRDVEELYEWVPTGTRVKIIGDLPGVSFDRQIVQGATGRDVVLVQLRLQELGFDAQGADGRFGPNSAAAVKELQRLYGLPVDGVVYEDVYYVLGLK